MPFNHPATPQYYSLYNYADSPCAFGNPKQTYISALNYRSVIWDELVVNRVSIRRYDLVNIMCADGLAPE